MSHSPILSMVTQDAFMANTALEKVDITDNPKLTEISLDSFSHLHNLKHLSLTNNSLLSIYVDAAVGVDERHFSGDLEVDISNNPLDCNCTLKSLSGVVRSEQIRCFTNKSPIDTFHLGNLLTGDLTCLSPHTIKVLFLGTLTAVIIAVVAVSVVVHLVHFRRNRKQQLLKLESSNVGSILMSLRHNGGKVVTDDIVLMSSLAWNDGYFDLSEKDQQRLQQQQLQHQQQQQHQLQPLHQIPQHNTFSIPTISRSGSNGGVGGNPPGLRYHPGTQQEPLCFIDLNSGSPCQCNYSYPYSNWS